MARQMLDSVIRYSTVIMSPRPESTAGTEPMGMYRKIISPVASASTGAPLKIQPTARRGVMFSLPSSLKKS